MAASTEVPPVAKAIRAPVGPDQQLAEISRKLDRLTEQVGYLYGRTAALEELREELVPIARDAMGAVTEELSAIEHEFNSEEVVYLLRKLLRNTPRFIRLLDRLESVDGLVTEVEPLGREVLRSVVDDLESIEQRGHLQLLKGAIAALDQVATHFKPEDLHLLAASGKQLAATARSLSSPQVLALARSVSEGMEDAAETVPERVGLFQLMRALRDPNVQAGLGFGVALLRKVGEATSQASGIHETPELQAGARQENRNEE